MIALSHIRGIFLRSLLGKVLDGSAHKDNLSVKLLQYGNWTDSFYYVSMWIGESNVLRYRPKHIASRVDVFSFLNCSNLRDKFPWNDF